MPQPDVATFLAEHRVSEAGQQVDQTIAGHAARQFHAASNGINSSFYVMHLHQGGPRLGILKVQ